MEAKDEHIFSRYFIWYQYLKSKDESNCGSADFYLNCSGCEGCGGGIGV